MLLSLYLCDERQATGRRHQQKEAPSKEAGAGLVKTEAKEADDNEFWYIPVAVRRRRIKNQWDNRDRQRKRVFPNAYKVL